MEKVPESRIVAATFGPIRVEDLRQLTVDELTEEAASVEDKAQVVAAQNAAAPADDEEIAPGVMQSDAVRMLNNCQLVFTWIREASVQELVDVKRTNKKLGEALWAVKESML